MPVQRVLMGSMEYPGYAMAGGLAMAVEGLSAALAKKGVEVKILVPDYYRDNQRLPAAGDGVELVPMPRPLFDGDAGLLLKSIYYRDNQPNKADKFFRTARDYARAIPDAVKQIAEKTRWKPDIVHLHDWQNASASELMQSGELNIPIVLTVHNARYIGQVPQMPHLEEALGPGVSYVVQAQNDYFRSLLELGIAFADAVNTVSPSYADEIMSGQHAVDPRLLRRIKERGLEGILNGINSQLMNPRTDKDIAAFNPDDMESVAYGKGINKLALHKYFGINGSPSDFQISMMARLVEQKGIDLVVDALRQMKNLGGIQFFVIGEPEDSSVELELKRLGGNVKFYTQFAAQSAQHLVLAGSDAMLIPSRFEPCGYTQMEGMRYGAVPIATHVGGLRDTVVPFDGSNGNGIIISEVSPQGIVRAVKEALRLYQDKEKWRALLANGLREDFSWNGPRNSVGRYIELYEKAIAKRAA